MDGLFVVPLVGGLYALLQISALAWPEPGWRRAAVLSVALLGGTLAALALGIGLGLPEAALGLALLLPVAVVYLALLSLARLVVRGRRA